MKVRPPAGSPAASLLIRGIPGSLRNKALILHLYLDCVRAKSSATVGRLCFFSLLSRIRSRMECTIVTRADSVQYEYKNLKEYAPNEIRVKLHYLVSKSCDTNTLNICTQIQITLKIFLFFLIFCAIRILELIFLNATFTINLSTLQKIENKKKFVTFYT